MRGKLSSTVEVRFFKLDYDAVLEHLKSYAKKVVSRGAKAVVLIGSLARGDYTAFSDADIIVISDNVPEKPMERLRDFIDPTLPVDVEPRVYTMKEFLKMAKEGRKVVKDVVKYGILLAGDGRVIDEAKKVLPTQGRKRVSQR